MASETGGIRGQPSRIQNRRAAHDRDRAVPRLHPARHRRPQTILGAHGRTHLLWKTLDLVPSDTGVSLLPTTSFDDFEGSLDVLIIAGVAGTNDAMRDDAIVDFLARTAASSRHVTSVCTGSLILGMAGLLEGRRAATHWAFYVVLKALRAVPVEDPSWSTATVLPAATSPQGSTSGCGSWASFAAKRSPR